MHAISDTVARYFALAASATTPVRQGLTADQGRVNVERIAQCDFYKPVKAVRLRETIFGETPNGETDRPAGAIHGDILGVVRSDGPTLIPRWTPGPASGVQLGSRQPNCCFPVPFRAETYAGGLGAGFRQRQGRFFGKPPGIRIHENPAQTPINTGLPAGYPGRRWTPRGVQRGIRSPDTGRNPPPFTEHRP